MDFSDIRKCASFSPKFKATNTVSTPQKNSDTLVPQWISERPKFCGMSTKEKGTGVRRGQVRVNAFLPDTQQSWTEKLLRAPVTLCTLSITEHRSKPQSHGVALHSTNEVLSA
jgi:hypothetical protein